MGRIAPCRNSGRRVFAVLALLVWCFSAVAKAAQSQPHQLRAASGWIVVWGGPEPSVYAVRTNGGGLRRLTQFDANAKRGDVARSGSLLVFDGAPVDGRRPDDFDIQVVRIETGTRRTIAGSPEREISGRFSPNGRWVSYSKQSASTGAWSVWIVDLTGKHSRRVTRGFDAHWAPDGRHLFFARSEAGQNDLFVSTLDGRHVKRLTRTFAMEEPAGWSPDGRRLLFTRDGDVFVMRSDGTMTTRLTHSGGEDVAGGWSPDGTRVAFTRDSHDVFVIGADGADSRRVFGRRGFAILATGWERFIA
jgi:TolB protein